MRTKKEITEFVLEQMNKKNITKSTLGESLGATGIGQMKIQRANGFLSTKSEKINMADVLVVAQLLELDPKDIILKETFSKEIKQDLPDLKINPNHLVPLVSHDKNNEEIILEWLVYPYDNSAYKKIIAIALADDRMQPTIKKGEILFVDNRLYSFDLQNQMVLASYKDQFIVGRFRRLENKQIQLSFENSKYNPLVYSIDNDHLEIVGVIVGHFGLIK